MRRMTFSVMRWAVVVRIFPGACSCLRLIRVLCAVTYERWMEEGRYLNMDLLQEQGRTDLRRLTA